MYQTFNRLYRALFGTAPGISSIAWRKIASRLLENAKTTHLPWVILFQNVYVSEDVQCAIVQPDPKAFKKWTWQTIFVLSTTKIVSYYSSNYLY